MRSRRFKYFVLAVVVVVGLQALIFHLWIPEVKSAYFAHNAVELKITPRWRYGYVRSWHGAVLVKARNGPGLKGLSRKSQPYVPDAETFAIMQRQLKRLPTKAGLEAALYLVIIAYVFYVWGWLKLGLLTERPTRIRVLGAEILGWTVLWLIIALPLLLWGYGTPLFSNCLGPGALSSSGIFLGAGPAFSSTVSYRGLLMVVAPFLLLGAELACRVASFFPQITEGVVLWLSGLIAFATLGLSLGLYRCCGKKGSFRDSN